jgi:hypothetical protein
MKKIFVLLIFLNLSAYDVPSFAQERYRSEALYRELDETAEKNGVFSMRDFLDEHSKNIKERMIILQWLKDKVWVQKNPDPFYSLVYSDMLFTTARYFDQNGEKKSADALFPNSYYMLKIFEILASTDAARCKDPSVTDVVDQLLKNRFETLEVIKNRMSSKERADIQRSALDYENALVNRRPYSIICTSGLEAFVVAASDPHHEQRTMKNSNQVGKQIVISSQKPFKPELISDEEWLKKRSDIRTRLEDRTKN